MKKGNWTSQEDAILRLELENKTSLKEIGERLNRSEEAIYLYCYRHHIALKEQLKNPLMRKLLSIKFGSPEFFKPNRSFLDRVGIGQKRWSAMTMGYVQPTTEELIKVAKELNYTADEAFALMEARQLDLFK